MAEKGKEKVTWMRLKAALDSKKNIKKVKKALCSFPQIRDQIFDEQSSTVTIKVVCCSPEKIMDKLCSKGRGAIKLIETIDPPKPPEPKEAEKPKEVEKPKEPEKPKPASEQAGPSSQPATMVQAYNPAPIMGQPIYNGSSYDSAQTLGYPSRPIYDSYGGVPPPPQHPNYGSSRFDHFNEENSLGCSIM